MSRGREPPFDPLAERAALLSRRALLAGAAGGLGALALGSLLAPRAFASGAGAATVGAPGGLPHLPPRARRVIWLTP